MMLEAKEVTDYEAPAQSAPPINGAGELSSLVGELPHAEEDDEAPRMSITEAVGAHLQGVGALVAQMRARQQAIEDGLSGLSAPSEGRVKPSPPARAKVAASAASSRPRQTRPAAARGGGAHGRRPRPESEAAPASAAEPVARRSAAVVTAAATPVAVEPDCQVLRRARAILAAAETLAGELGSIVLPGQRGPSGAATSETGASSAVSRVGSKALPRPRPGLASTPSVQAPDAALLPQRRPCEEDPSSPIGPCSQEASGVVHPTASPATPASPASVSVADGSPLPPSPAPAAASLLRFVPRRLAPELPGKQQDERREERRGETAEDLEEEEEAKEEDDACAPLLPTSGCTSEPFLWVPLLLRGAVTKGTRTVFFQDVFPEGCEAGDGLPGPGAQVQVLGRVYRVAESDASGPRLVLDRDMETRPSNGRDPLGLSAVLLRVPLAQVSARQLARARRLGCGRVQREAPESESDARRALVRQRQATERRRMAAEEAQSRAGAVDEQRKRELSRKAEELRERTAARLRARGESERAAAAAAAAAEEAKRARDAELALESERKAAAMAAECRRRVASAAAVAVARFGEPAPGAGEPAPSRTMHGAGSEPGLTSGLVSDCSASQGTGSWSRRGGSSIALSEAGNRLQEQARRRVSEALAHKRRQQTEEHERQFRHAEQRAAAAERLRSNVAAAVSSTAAAAAVAAAVVVAAAQGSRDAAKHAAESSVGVASSEVELRRESRRRQRKYAELAARLEEEQSTRYDKARIKALCAAVSQQRQPHPERAERLPHAERLPRLSRARATAAERGNSSTVNSNNNNNNQWDNEDGAKQPQQQQQQQQQQQHLEFHVMEDDQVRDEMDRSGGYPDYVPVLKRAQDALSPRALDLLPSWLRGSGEARQAPAAAPAAVATRAPAPAPAPATMSNAEPDWLRHAAMPAASSTRSGSYLFH